MIELKKGRNKNTRATAITMHIAESKKLSVQVDFKIELIPAPIVF